jgi:hypothetical protein
MVKACRHFKAMYGLGGEFETTITPKENFVDGCVEVYDKRGNLVMKKCFAELYLKYLYHLSTYWGCLDEIEASREWLESQLFRIWLRRREKADQ